MTRGDLISVIVPVYNSGEYLDRCVGSILSQDYSPIEVLIVDDGSTDPATIEKCDFLAANSPNVFVFHITNGGAGAARNFGLRHAKGRYIAFVDSDDEIATGMYSSLYCDLIGHDVKLAAGGIAIEDNGRLINKLKPLPSGVYRQPDIMHHFFLGHWHSACTNLYERSVFDTARFPEGEINEDYVLNYLILREQQAIYNNSQAYYHYIRREGSNTSAAVSPRFKDWLKHTESVYDDFKDNAYLGDAACYQYLFSYITLGNVCLLTLARGASSDADELYRSVTKMLMANRAQISACKSLSARHRLYGMLMAVCPGLYRTIVTAVLRIKSHLHN